MRILVSADWHLKLWSDKEMAENNIPLRLHEIFNAIRQMCEYARDHKIDLFIVAGDINDLKNIIHAKAFILLKKILEEYEDLQFLFLHGNHDSTERIDKDSSIELLCNDRNIRCHVNAVLVEGDITFLPYSKNMVEQLRQLDRNKILIGHFGVNEAQLSNGTSIKSSIKLSDLTKFDKVILGHYHKPQELANVIYVGSPIQLRRDEAGEEKRFLVVDTDNLQIESVPITGYRKYYTLIIDDVETAMDVSTQAEELMALGNFVCIRKQIADSVVLPDNVQVIEDFEEDYQLRGITSAMGLGEQMKKYLEIENVPEEEHNEYTEVGEAAIR